MHPFDKIQSRDHAAFPFQEFSNYRRLFMVDWREAESSIAEAFLRAAGLPASDTVWTWNDADHAGTFSCRGRAYPVVATGGRSAQHDAVAALQAIYSATHSIRLLNHVARGDTAYFVVETPDTWKRLEERNPAVRWFFTPLEYLYDCFETSFEDLSEAGRLHAEGLPPEPKAPAPVTTNHKVFLDHCRARLAAERARSSEVPAADRLRIPAPLARLADHPLRAIYSEQPRLFAQGQVVWAHIVQANTQLFELGEADLPAAFVYSLDPWFDDHPETLGEMATQLFAQKGSANPDPALAEFARIITSETEIAYNLRVPQERTAGREVYYTTAMVHRNHLHEWVLKALLLPYLAAPGKVRSSMILPHRYWPSPAR